MEERQDIPKHWVEISLDKLLVVFESGSRPKGGVRGILKGIPSIGGEHLNYNRSFNTESIKYVPKSFAERMTQGRIEVNDILIVKDGATTAKTCFVDDTFPFSNAVANEHIFICRISEEVFPKYVFWYLWSEVGQKKILANFSGVAIGGINKSFASNVVIPLPPYLEQKLIADTLDDIFYQLDYYENRLKAINEAMVQYREMVLEQAVSGELTEDWRAENEISKNIDIEINRIIEERSLTSKKAPLKANNEIKIEIPNEWRKVSLDTIIKNIVTGKSFKCLERPPKTNEVGVLKLSAVSWKKYDEEESKTCTDSSKINTEIYIQKGDFLISRANTVELVGACVIAEKVTKNVMLSDKILRITFINTLEKYVVYILRSRIGRKQIEAVATGSQESMKNISQYKIRNIVIPFPSLLEQQEIVKQVENLFKKADKVQEYCEDTAKYLAKVRKIVLEKAFNGTLVKPVDEEMSVEELLKKIAIEKEAIEKQQKTARKTRIHQPKPPKMTKENLKAIIQETFPTEAFSYEMLHKVLEGKFQFDYEDLRNSLFELIRLPLKDGEEAAFLQTDYQEGILFKINATTNETENS